MKVKCLLVSYRSAAGQESFRRHIIIDDFKPAIFGSFAYDPIREIFDNMNENPKNEPMPKEDTPAVSAHVEALRKATAHMVRSNTVTDKATAWWMRNQAKNMAKNMTAL